jgi:hypothetical protein
VTVLVFSSKEVSVLTLLPTTVAHLNRLDLRPREIAADGGFRAGPTTR